MHNSNHTIKSTFQTLTKVIAGITLLVVFFAPLQGIVFAVPAVYAQTEPAPGSPVYNAAMAQVPQATATANAAAGVQDTGVNNANWCENASTCLTSVVYLFTVGLMSTAAYVGASVFNFGLRLALNGLSYSLNFLSQGWSIVRDIANLAFIFILIYIAYTIIVEAETAGTMKTLAVVVTMALLINFSFFLTRVVIDAGNILAVQFYNAIPAQPLAVTAQSAAFLSGGAGAKISTALGANGNVKDLTGGIMSAVSVQSLLNTDSFKNFTNNNGFLINVIVQSTVYIAIGAIFAILAAMFITVGLKFLVRMVTLWFLVVAAPLAFAAKAVPANHHFNVQGYYDKWQQALIESSFYPAVFLFMFFIITLVMNGMGSTSGLVPSIFKDLNTVPAGSSATFVLGAAIANVIVRLGLVIIMLLFAMKVSDSFVQYGGSTVKNAVNWAGGLPARAAIGGAGWAGRNTIGRGANAIARTDAMRNLESISPTIGGGIRSVFKNTSKASFDARNAGVSSGTLNLGKAGGKDGYAGDMKRRSEDIIKQAKDLKSTTYEKEKAARDFETFKKNHEGGVVGFEAAKKRLEESREFNQRLAQNGATDGIKAIGARRVEEKTEALKGYQNGADKIKRLDDERLKNLQDAWGERGITNLGFIPGPLTGPSRGSIEGAKKVGNMIAGKEELQDTASHFLHALQAATGDTKGHEEHKEEVKKANDAKPTTAADPHHNEHLTTGQIRTSEGRTGGLSEVDDKVLDKLGDIYQALKQQNRLVDGKIAMASPAERAPNIRENPNPSRGSKKDDTTK